MATKIIDDTVLQDIAVAIQSKDNGGKMTVDEMSTRIALIPTQDNALLNSLIGRGIISIENSEVTNVGSYVFCNCANLTSVSFPNATSIGNNAFNGCANLTSVSFPNVTNIGNNAFYGCANLTSVSFPNVTRFSEKIFYGCANLTSVSFPNATYIGNNAFNSCGRLSTLILGKRAALSNSSVFSNADNAIIYVQPEDLTWYSTATNWSVLYTDGRVKSIEELPT